MTENKESPIENDSEKKISDSNHHDNTSNGSYHSNKSKSFQDDQDSNMHDKEVPQPRRKSSIWVRAKKKMSLTEKGATPIQWKTLLLVFLSLFASAFSLTFLFPFLPDMVLWFGYNEEDKGYYAGFIASAMFAGRTCGSYFWGWLSDRFGRKPIILITVFLSGLFSLMFGFTVNFPMAMISRFLTGLANGTVGTAKTMIYEISDNTNQAVGMSFLSMAWGAGLILGPAFGGLLANPVEQYPEVFAGSDLLIEFPFLLPGLLVFIACTLISVVEFFFLEETLKSKRENMELIVEEEKTKDSSENQNDEITILVDETDDKISNVSVNIQKPKISMSVENLNLHTESAYYQVQRDVCSQESLNKINKHSSDKEASMEDQEFCQLLTDRNKSDTYKLQGRPELKRNISINSNYSTKSANGVLQTSSSHEDTNCNGHESIELTVKEIKEEKKNWFVSCCQSLRETSLVRLVSQSDVRHPIILYMTFSFAVIGFEEIFTIWASTDPMLDGLGFSPGEIGAVLGFSAVPLLLLNAFVFPWCAKRFGIKNTYLGCSMLMMIFIALQPMPHLIYDRKLELWASLLVIILPFKIVTSCCFTATAIFINNSVEPSEAGAVNGIAMTSTAIGRTLAPTVGGSIYAWSISYGAKHIGPPFDVNLAFFVMSLVMFFTIIYGITLPERLTRQKK